MDVMLRLPRGVDGFEGVLDESLRAADRPRHVESAVEIAEVLRRLESFLERGLRKSEGRTKALQLTRVDLAHPRIIALDHAYAPGAERSEAHPSRIADSSVLARAGA